ncbi:hypothetical protein [Shimia sp.]|uniref:hypothetical protein n=1 Tax=Shimia sp. TaxID=1954381 RepID=UPI003296A0A0
MQRKKISLLPLSVTAHFLVLAAATSVSPTPVMANEIGWKCGYITQQHATYTYRHVRVRPFPDEIDCTAKYRKKYPGLVAAEGFQGEIDDQEIRANVAKRANSQDRR